MTTDADPDLLGCIAVGRVHDGDGTRQGDHYVDYGHPTPSYLTGVFDELAENGLLALAQEDPGGLRRVRLTQAGHARYAQPSATPRGAALPVPDPQFPTPTPAGRPSTSAPPSRPAPGGQLVPSEVSLCGSVLAPIPVVRSGCAPPHGQDSGSDAIACRDAEGTVPW